MTTETVYRGGCLCGEVRFAATGAPQGISTCHCRTCQRAAGGDSVAWVGFPLNAVSWAGVDATVFASSPGVERRFCPRCGTSLSYQIAVDSIDLALACLDDPESLAPEKEIWLDHRLSWNVRNPDVPGYREFSSSGLLVE